MPLKKGYGMAHSFEYAVLRFCPDERRGETVNIGIVVFVDGHLDIRLTSSFTKAQALYPNLSFDGLQTFPGRINNLLTGISSVKKQHALLRDFGPITVSELGCFEVFLADQYEAQIDRLFEDFVIPPRAKARPRAKPSQLKLKVSNIFKSAGLLGKTPSEINAHKVVPGFPVSIEENLFADFAFKNGIYRFAEVVDLCVSPTTLPDKFKECCEKAISLDMAKRKFGSESARLVLFSAPEQYSPLVDSSLNLLQDYATRVLNANSEEDLLVFQKDFASTSQFI
jgi:hypothetical protein